VITLLIKEKGYLIEIPGLAPFRTPANVDISRVDIRLVIGHLKVNGVQNYKIIAEDQKGATEVYTAKDFSTVSKKKKVDPYKKEIDSRFNKLEKMLSELLEKETRNDSKKEEQITEKLNELEQLSKEILKKKPEKVIYKDTKGQTWEKDEDEEVARFIPEVEIENMKLTSTPVKSVKQEKEELVEKADALSEFLGRTRKQ
jgi:hypothetical protein